MLEASEVPDLRDEADGRHKRDAAQRLQHLHDRRPAPRGRELPELVGDALRGVNYFCRSTTTISAGEGLAKGVPLATAAELGNCRWPVTGRL